MITLPKVLLCVLLVLSPAADAGDERWLPYRANRPSLEGAAPATAAITFENDSDELRIYVRRGFSAKTPTGPLSAAELVAFERYLVEDVPAPLLDTHIDGIGALTITYEWASLSSPGIALVAYHWTFSDSALSGLLPEPYHYDVVGIIPGPGGLRPVSLWKRYRAESGSAYLVGLNAIPLAVDWPKPMPREIALFGGIEQYSYQQDEGSRGFALRLGGVFPIDLLTGRVLSPCAASDPRCANPLANGYLVWEYSSLFMVGSKTGRPLVVAREAYPGRLIASEWDPRLRTFVSLLHQPVEVRCDRSGGQFTPLCPSGLDRALSTLLRRRVTGATAVFDGTYPEPLLELGGPVLSEAVESSALVLFGRYHLDDDLPWVQ